MLITSVVKPAVTGVRGNDIPHSTRAGDQGEHTDHSSIALVEALPSREGLHKPKETVRRHR